jgi:hypothetical protein
MTNKYKLIDYQIDNAINIRIRSLRSNIKEKYMYFMDSLYGASITKKNERKDPVVVNARLYYEKVRQILINQRPWGHKEEMSQVNQDGFHLDNLDSFLHELYLFFWRGSGGQDLGSSISTLENSSFVLFGVGMIEMISLADEELPTMEFDLRQMSLEKPLYTISKGYHVIKLTERDCEIANILSFCQQSGDMSKIKINSEELSLRISRDFTLGEQTLKNFLQNNLSNDISKLLAHSILKSHTFPESDIRDMMSKKYPDFTLNLKTSLCDNFKRRIISLKRPVLIFRTFLIWVLTIAWPFNRTLFYIIMSLFTIILVYGLLDPFWFNFKIHNRNKELKSSAICLNKSSAIKIITGLGHVRVSQSENMGLHCEWYIDSSQNDLFISENVEIPMDSHGYEFIGNILSTQFTVQDGYLTDEYNDNISIKESHVMTLPINYTSEIRHKMKNVLEIMFKAEIHFPYNGIMIREVSANTTNCILKCVAAYCKKHSLPIPSNYRKTVKNHTKSVAKFIYLMEVDMAPYPEEIVPNPILEVPPLIIKRVSKSDESMEEFKKRVEENEMMACEDHLLEPVTRVKSQQHRRKTIRNSKLLKRHHDWATNILKNPHARAKRDTYSFARELSLVSQTAVSYYTPPIVNRAKDLNETITYTKIPRRFKWDGNEGEIIVDKIYNSLDFQKIRKKECPTTRYTTTELSQKQKLKQEEVKGEKEKKISEKRLMWSKIIERLSNIPASRGLSNKLTRRMSREFNVFEYEIIKKFKSIRKKTNDDFVEEVFKGISMKFSPNKSEKNVARMVSQVNRISYELSINTNGVVDNITTPEVINAYHNKHNKFLKKLEVNRYKGKRKMIFNFFHE